LGIRLRPTLNMKVGVEVDFEVIYSLLFVSHYSQTHLICVKKW